MSLKKWDDKHAAAVVEYNLKKSRGLKVQST